jgi:hypothetical protein
MADRTTPHTPNARTREGRKDWAPAFLAALKGATVGRAAHAAGVGRRTAYDRRERDPEFAEQWDAAIEEGIEELEAEAARRAMEGSDTLIMFLLKARRPKVYSERYRVEHAGRIEAPPAAMAPIADHLDPDVQAALTAFLRSVGHARERRLAADGKLGSMTPAEVDERHRRFDDAWSRRG